MCVQYRGDMISTVGDIISTVKDILNTVGDAQYCGGYLEYRGGGGVNYRGKGMFIDILSRYLLNAPTVLKISANATHDIPHGTGPPDGTEHT